MARPATPRDTSANVGTVASQIQKAFGEKFGSALAARPAFASKHELAAALRHLREFYQ